MNTININSTIDNINQINITADAEIMENYQGAYPVSADHEIEAVQDNAGNLMVFALSDDGHFYLILQNPDSATGWKQIDLTNSLSNYGTPASFSVGQLENGNITIAVSIPDATDATRENIFIASPLSNDPSQTPWDDLSPFWINAGAAKNGGSVQKIFIGPIDSGTGYGIPFLAVSSTETNDAGVSNYILQAEIQNGSENWNWIDFPTPTDKNEMLAYAIGSIGDLGQGVYMLYTNTSKETVLIFKTFDLGHGSFDRGLVAPEGATTLQSLAGSNGTTRLFVGGANGVNYFSSGNQLKNAVSINIASANFIPDIEKYGLIARQDTSEDGVIAIWALSGEHLMYFTNYAENPEIWTQPITFLTGTAQMCAIRNKQKQANELVYICTDLEQHPSIYYMWQDPSSTIWQKEEIPLEDTGNTYQFNCFTSTLTFTDENNQAIVNLAVDISSSYWTRMLVNGTTHITDTDISVSALTDAMGNITIINKTDSFSSPTFTLTAGSETPAFDGSLTLNPVYKVYSRLSTVQDATDIPDYIFANGLPEGITQDDVAYVVSQLMLLQLNGNSMQAACIVYNEDAVNTTTTTPQLKMTAKPNFGISFQNGSTQLHRTAHKPLPSLQTNVIGDAWDATVDFLGDLWQFADTVLDKVTDIVVTVVEDVVKFVIYLAEETIEIIIETIGDVLKAVWYIFKTLAIVLADLIKWLGFLFSWDDIWTMHKVVSNLITDNIDYFVKFADSEIETLKSEVQKAFLELKAGLATILLPGSIAATEIYATSNNLIAQNPDINFNSPGINWSFYQMQHGGGLSGSISTDVTASSDGENPFEQLYNDAIAPFINAIGTDLKDMYNALKKLFTGNSTINDLLVVLNDFADTLLTAIESIILALLDIAEDFLKMMQSLVSDPINIPFISSFYKWLTDLLGEEEELTAANVLGLVIAIPLNLIYKLGTGKSPFENGTFGLEQPGVFDSLTQGIQLGGTTTSRTMVSAQNVRSSSNPFDMKSAYIDIGGICSAIISPIISILSLASSVLKHKKKNAASQADKDVFASGINFLTCTSFVFICGNIAATFPVPLKKSNLGDNLSYLIYICSFLKLGTPFIAAGSSKLAAGYDGILYLSQLIMAIIVDVEDEENASKYTQDILASSGGALNDLAIMIEGSDGVGLVCEVTGLSMQLISSIVKSIRVVDYIASDTEDYIRVGAM